jgi:drug/metabolite transporter (DMT)-like permease
VTTAILAGGHRRRHRPQLAGGAALVALGAALWGTDALFRRGLALELRAVEVVFWEHLLLAVISLALVLPAVGRLRALNARDWLAIGVIGGGSSVVATILFTEAFRHGDPTTPLLLQKLQPVFAAGAAFALLGERLRPRYFAFFALALGGSYLITFADPGSVSLERLLPAALGAGAALLWALGTVLGKHAGAKVPPAQLAGLRFLCGLPVATVLLVALAPAEGLTQAGGDDVLPIVLLSLVPGLAALLLYYRGLRGTPASAATLAEMAFPVTALAVNAVAFGTVLTATQFAGAALLAGTVLALTLADRHGAAGVESRPVERGPRTPISLSRA